MRVDVLFATGIALSLIDWCVVVFLYLTKVVPILKEQKGSKVELEVAFQLNFTRHLKKYRELAEKRGDKSMIYVHRLISILVVVAMLLVLASSLVSIFDE
jgi:hypothetical protein